MQMGRLGSGFGRLGAVSSGPSYSAEAKALFAAMSTTPTAARKALINTLIVSLKNAGVWDECSVLSLFAAADNQAGRLNWKNPGSSGGQIWTATNSPVFEADRGYTGDGSNSYLDLGVGFSSLSTVALNDCSFLVWSRSDVNAAQRDFGAVTDANTFIIGRTSGNMQTRANAGTADANAVASSVGWYGFNRTANNAYTARKNGAQVDAETTASTALAAGNVTVLRGASVYSTRQIAAVWCGGALNGTQDLALYNAILAYLQGVGAAS